MLKPVSFISTVMERASAITSRTAIMSAAPATKDLMNLLSERPPTIAMTIEAIRNQVEVSSKYHSPKGNPVSTLDQPTNAVMPKLSQGIKPTIMTTKVMAKTIRTPF